MKQDIQKTIQECEVCAKWKPQVTKPPLVPIVAQHPLERVLIDFTEIGEDSLSYRYLLLMIDSFTKFVWGEAFPTKEALPVARFLLKTFLNEGKFRLS